MNTFPPSKVLSEPSTAKFQIVKSNAYPFNDRIVAAHQMAFMNGNTNNGEEVSQKVNTSPTTLFTSTPQSLVPKPKEATFTSLLSASKKKWCYEDYEGDDNVRKYYCPKHKREYKDRDTFRRHLRTAQHGSEYKLEEIEKYRVATTKNVNSDSKKQKFDEECNKQCDADCADCESSDESDDDVNDEPDDDDGNETDDDYVDGNDGWRHSKWLAFMERRLALAKRLLRPESSVLIVTIDEHEVHHLAMLIEREFPEARTQMVSTMINPANVARAGSFGRSDEYIFFVMLGSAAPARLRLAREWVSAKGRTHTESPRV